MTFDRNANLKAWREANPERYRAQRLREFNARKQRRKAAKGSKGRLGTGKYCNCKAGPKLPPLEFCPKFRAQENA